MFARGVMMSCAALACIAAAAPAQQWNLDAQGGRVRSALDRSAPADETFALGLRYDAPSSALRLTAGMPLSSQEYMWGSLAAWKRAAVRRSGFLMGMDLSGNALALHDRRDRQPESPVPLPPGSPVAGRQSGQAFAAQVLPVAGYEFGSLEIQARGGISYYTSSGGGQSTDRTVRLADLQLTYAPTPNVILVPAVRWYSAADEDASSYAGLTAAVAAGRLSLWGSAGQWLNITADERTAWGAGGSLRFHDRASLTGAVRRDVFDPLYLSVPQTSWSVGVSVRLAGTSGPPPPPVPDAYVNGVATVRIPVSAARPTPSIAGDFNNWSPVPMRRVGNHWVYDVRVAPGVYHYAFVDPDGTWFVPRDVPGRRDDGMGGHVAVLVVR